MQNTESNELYEVNYAQAWLDSTINYVLTKTTEGETSLLALEFDSNMEFDENQETINLSLDGLFLKSGWSFKQEIAEFAQEDGDDGLSSVTADYYLNIQNLDNPATNKRYKIHSFNLLIPAKKQLSDGSFEFLTAKENKKLLENKVQDAFSQAMSQMRNPGQVNAIKGNDNFRNRHNPFQKTGIVAEGAVPVEALATPVTSANKGTIELSKKHLGWGLGAFLVIVMLSWAIAQSGNDDKIDPTHTANEQAQNNPLIAANNNDSGAVAALNLTTQTLEGMGLDVSKTGSDLGCLTSN